MSKNNVKKPAKEITKKNNGGEAVVKFATNRLALIITAAVLVLVLATTGIIILVDYIKNDKGFDYLDSDLSKYIEISKENYKNYKLTVEISKPREDDVKSAILSLQAMYKGDRLCGENQWFSSGKDLVVTPGSIVKIRYRGYKVSADGEIIEVAGLTNFNSLESTQLEIGSLMFPTGFEVNLLGAPLSSDRAMFSKVTSGSLTDELVAYVSYTKTQTSNSEKTTASYERIDLESDVDSVYGQGFKAKLMEIAIGDTKEFTLTDVNGAHCEYKLTVDFATNCEKQENILKVDTYFPYNYGVEELKNADVVFEVYIESIQPFEYDEYNNEFVEELLKKEETSITAEDLDEYEGEGIADRYVAFIESNLQKNYEKSYDELVEKAMWAHMHEAANIKKFPASKVDPIYNEYIIDITERFETSGGKIYNSSTLQYNTYSTLDEYATAYLGLTGVKDYTWRDYIKDASHKLVAERMILFYIMDAENLMPSKQEFDEKYEELRQEYLDAYVEEYLSYDEKTREDFTDEEYERYVSARASEIFSYYDEEYFTETTYYTLALETIISWANVTTFDDAPVVEDK